jgi:drug/metabolite transporter (DMT)-like permease
MLFAYAALFSFAYITLDTGVGALILFGSVQITMVLISLFRGNRLGLGEWLGLVLACAGLVYLVLPELSKPSLAGFIMMSISGVAWGHYTVLGQGAQSPLGDTASNFIKAAPMTVLLLLPFLGQVETPFNNDAVTTAWLLAIASGAITSGIGYAIWYSALRNLTTSQAGVMQLLVPIIAALGGVVFAGELLSMRLVFASLMTLGGILIVIRAKSAVGEAQ